MRPVPRPHLAASLAFAALLAAGSAAARADDDARRADALVAEAEALMRGGRTAAALVRWQEAYEHDPHPGRLLPVARAEEALGRHLDALVHYEQILADPTAPAPVAAVARRRVRAVERRIAIVAIDVEPAGAVVRLDGVEIGRAPLARPARVAPGAHVLVIALPGHVDVRRRFDVRAGDRLREVIRLEPAPAPPADARPPAPVAGRAVPADLPTPRARPAAPPPVRVATADGHPVDEPETPGRRGVVVGVVATGVLATASVITGLLAWAAHADYVDGSSAPAVREDARVKGRRLAITSDVLFGATLAGAAATAIWFVVQRRVIPPRRALAPVVLPDGAAIALQGRF